MSGGVPAIKTYYCEEYLENESNVPSSNNKYFGTIVTSAQANADDSWLPYWYQSIKCNLCEKDSGYLAKCWFWFIGPVSGVLAGFTCNKCLNAESLIPETTTKTSENSVSVATTLLSGHSPDHSNYEGAGFLLTYQDKFILSARLKKANETDPIKEVEYFGGKPEPEDQGDPYQTAFAELIEEAGGNILDSNWRQRVTTLRTFQPISQKWIWCFLLELNKTEFTRLQVLDIIHDQWEVGTERSFQTLTGRKGLARKAIEGIAVASAEDVLNYVQGFKNFKLIDCNRMQEAKAYGQTNQFQCQRLSDSREVYQRRLRGFNLVMLEEHLPTIKGASS